MIQEPETLYKLMILYMLNKVNFPLTNSQLTQFFLDKEYTTYFTLQQVLSELEPRDRTLIILRYLNRNTQQATADKLGMTQVQVSRRERIILEEMRKKLIS